MHEEICGKYNDALKDSLRKCILTRSPDISFKDIAGNDYAKEIINTSFVLPNLCPIIFQKTKVHPWQSILLYGPPGVGKTMLAQAVCNHSRATCFWVSVTDITSKYIGESEQRLILLFELAREHAPSIILIDEMDSLGRRRTGNESETERRIKTEFLRQMDEIKRIPESVSVFATTNMPWELDIAALRRFERRVLVPMPNLQNRKDILELHAGD
jgi:SpoVK/Ycf46/Vps4 family AAA+-type ATPase